MQGLAEAYACQLLNEMSDLRNAQSTMEAGRVWKNREKAKDGSSGWTVQRNHVVCRMPRNVKTFRAFFDCVSSVILSALQNTRAIHYLDRYIECVCAQTSHMD